MKVPTYNKNNRKQHFDQLPKGAYVCKIKHLEEQLSRMEESYKRRIEFLKQQIDIKDDRIDKRDEMISKLIDSIINHKLEE